MNSSRRQFLAHTAAGVAVLAAGSLSTSTVNAGATPRQALYAATVEPAKFLGMTADLGSVESRKIADLVVLDAVPLKDIRNSRKIHSVVTRGRVISPAARQRMLAGVEVAVNAPPTPATIAAGGCCGSARTEH